MRGWPLFILVVILLSSGAQALERHAAYTNADADADSALAPLSTLIAATPAVIDAAIREAEHDGTPDEAEALVEDMRSFALGFDSALDPSTTEAFDPRALSDAAEVVFLLEPLPGEIGHLARTGAACASWSGNATTSEMRGWLIEVQPVIAGMEGSLAGFDRLADQYADRVDTSALREAGTRLSDWLDAKATRTISCFNEAGVYADMALLYLSLSPATSWPSGTVVARGAVLYGDASGDVHLDVHALGIERVARLGENGGFAFRFTVPVDADVGNYTVNAIVGDLAGNATLTVDPAPTRLVLHHPPRVEPEQVIRVGIRLLAPPGLPPPNAVVDVGGYHREEVTVVEGAGVFRTSAPSTPGVVEGFAAYNGSRLLGPAYAEFKVLVAAPALAASVDQEEGQSAIRLPLIGSLPSPGLPDEGPAVVGLVALCILAVSAGIWFARRRMQRATPTPPVRQGPRPTSGTPSHQVPSGGPLALFVKARHLLMKVGIIRPSQTAREMHTTLKSRWGVDSQAVVRQFEELRYGGRLPSLEPEPAFKRWARDVWRRVKGAP